MQSDPIGLLGGANTFAYAGTSPLAYMDPLGLWWFGDPLPQGVVDFSAGLGDGALATLSFGFVSGQRLRDSLNIGSVNVCATEYRGGLVTGTAATLSTYAGAAIPKILIHYTTRAGAAGIAATGLRASTGLTLFGDGVYATAGSRLFVPPAATIPLLLDGAGFVRMIPGAVYLNPGSLQTALIFAGYGAGANREAFGQNCKCEPR